MPARHVGHRPMWWVVQDRPDRLILALFSATMLGSSIGPIGAGQL